MSARLTFAPGQRQSLEAAPNTLLGGVSLADPSSKANLLSVCALVLAVVALMASFVLPGAAGPQGPAGSGLATSYVWGYAIVIECNSSFSPGSTTFRVHYINIGGASASGAEAHYSTLNEWNSPVTLTGKIAIGTIPGSSSGSVTHTIEGYSGCRGVDVDVSFTWT